MKKLRDGFTTGSCAAAAALACCIWIRDGECPGAVEIVIPEGRTYRPEIIPHEDGSCGIIKDSGDDPDITNGMEVISSVKLLEGDGPVSFKAGDGVGIITQQGLKVPVGDPAINPVPRQMIEEAVRSVFGARAAEVTVSIPGGREIAAKTFNPRLGIKDGLSVLGTTGLLRPMSLEALRDSLYVELKMRVSQGHEELIFTFGNQGEKALSVTYKDIPMVQVSNEIGFMLDSARELGVKKLIVGGHPGKMTKIAAGIMQTHSHTADGRREGIITQLALMGAPKELCCEVYKTVTTDKAAELIHEAGYDGVWDMVADAAREYMVFRVRGEIEIHAVVADFAGNIMGESRE
ncbi:MAG: cobalt-precorrin-5B (C(1))-methyltransferase CbiD [Clostridia bacterium]|nr:cobalt-precorrin-5B (C(1))-methyltransferase CbiD [Clostridia bacterium]